MELKDELEVPGHVVGYVMANNVITAKQRLNELMDKWEEQGYKTPNQVPESPEKEEYRNLLRQLGVEVNF